MRLSILTYSFHDVLNWDVESVLSGLLDYLRVGPVFDYPREFLSNVVRKRHSRSRGPLFQAGVHFIGEVSNLKHLCHLSRLHVQHIQIPIELWITTIRCFSGELDEWG